CMDRQFNPKKLTDRPRWLRDLKLVVMCVFGRSVFEPGAQLHNYDDGLKLVDLLARYNAPATTLIYAPGALVRSYDGGLPDYWPRDEQGGEAGFRKFLDHAHSKGFKVMCETNPFGVDYVHPLYAKFKAHRTSDAYAAPGSRGYCDCEGDKLKEFFAYISPCCAEWRKFIVRSHRRLAEKFPIDMILLDQHFQYFNDPNCNFDEALAMLYGEIARASSPILLAGESCHERVVGTDVPFSVVNFDLYSSNNRPPWVKVHPIDIELFRDYVVYCGHEGALPSPGHAHTTGWPSDARIAETKMSFRDQQERNTYLNLVPTLRITPRLGDLDEETAAIITRAASFKY
ncbi:MAG: hypothetical protein QF662_08150, partial [Phycisphaerae bacterium]|nr:hypothetical protein [Phycisphaerae bacterium]